MASPLGLQLLDLISRSDPASLTDDDLVELLARARRECSLYRGDYDQHVAALKSRSAELSSLAEWLPQRMPHWWGDLDRAQQVWLGPTADPPEDSQLVVDLSPFSPLVSKPKHAFWTSTFNSTVVSPWLDWVRFGEDQRPGPYHLWRATVSTTARVAEIHSPAAWSALAMAYPSLQAAFRYSVGSDQSTSYGRLDPDWSRVSEEWDAVHLSVGGLLTAEDVAFTSGRLTTELRSWNMESTAWFRWSFKAVEPLTQGLDGFSADPSSSPASKL